jgi:RNA polymerase sigma-70 factor (ECF subfamily)
MSELPFDQMMEARPNPGQIGPRWFATTHWSVVLTAGKGDSELASQALATLCQTYWYPLYSYVRNKGYGPEDAEDLTQGFFARLLQRRDWERADRTKGKFRYFLLVAVKNFLADAHDHAAALKRGGGWIEVSFDATTAEERFKLEPVDTLTPEKLYERRWALTLLEEALNRLKAEYIVARKEALFGALKPFLRQSERAPTYAEVAVRLGLTEAAVKSALHRLRQRYSELVREEIAQTVSTAVEVEEEIRHLIAVMGN